MSTIREQLKTTFLGLAGLLSKMNVMQNTSQQILTAVENIDIDTSDLAKEATLGDVASVLEYMEQGGMPEIENIAKQGTNPDATNTAILAAVEVGVPQVAVPDTTASQELAPNTLYLFPNRTSDLTLTLGTPITGEVNEYHFILEVGATLPTITLPTGLTWKVGYAPVFDINTSYEVSILNNYAIFVTW